MNLESLQLTLNKEALGKPVTKKGYAGNFSPKVLCVSDLIDLLFLSFLLMRFIESASYIKKSPSQGLEICGKGKTGSFVSGLFIY